MKTIKLTHTILILIVLIMPVLSSAKNPVTPPGASLKFTGVVIDKDTQEQLGGVYIYFDDLKKGVYSGADGIFNLEGIEPGDYKVTIKYISYHEKKVSVKVKKSKKNHKTIELEPVQP